MTQIRSTWTLPSPPPLTGLLTAAEWSGAAKLGIPSGTLLAQNDGRYCVMNRVATPSGSCVEHYVFPRSAYARAQLISPASKSLPTSGVRKNNPANVKARCCVSMTLLAMALFAPAISSQTCRGNSYVGCTNAGAACTRVTTGYGTTGICKSPAGFPKGERSCECTGSATPPPPTPVTVTPKYMIMAIAYAPPGCSIGSPSQCGTSNGSSFVDYSTSTANGTKITTKDSFQLGLTISYNATFLGSLNGGGSYAIQNTTSDSTAVNETKTSANDWNVQGNGDGVDHGQDQFFLLLHPKVTLAKSGSQIQWGFSNPGAPFTVYAYELLNPSTARPSTTQVLQEVGLTNDDYQAILKEDPFGGQSSPGAGLDPNRFWYTGLSFPYEPAATLANCNNGGVCNCASYTGSLTNDKVSDTGTEDSGQTTVDLVGGISVPLTYSLQIDTKLVWTTSSTTDNTTESKQVATATVTCPSTKYAGPFGIQAWWDSRYGSFVLVPYDPGAVSMIHQGKVVSASNQPVSGQLVTMVYNGKTHRTYTGHDGSYGFPAWSGAPAFTGTAQIKTGSLTQTVNVGKVAPIVMQMK